MKASIMQTAYIAVVISFFVIGCSSQFKKQDHASKVLDEPSSSTDPNAPSLSVEAKGNGNLKGLLDPIYWYKGDFKPNYPKCGDPIPKKCEPPIGETDVDECTQTVKSIQKANFEEKGFYLARISDYSFCQKKCTPSKPNCKGIKCIGAGLSFAGKKVLEWTDACNQACTRAISRGVEFPYECKNLNDEFNRKEIVDEIRKKEDEARRDPAIQKQLRELEAINAQNADTERRIEAMKKAEAALPGWVDSIYKPRMTSLVEKMKVADDRILAHLDRLLRDVQVAQGTAISVQNSLTSGAVTPKELESNRQALEAARPSACQVYNFDPLVRDGESVLLEIRSLGNELLSRLEEVGNKPLIETTKKELESLLNTVKATPIGDEVRNGSFPREVCEHFRQMMLANSLALTLKEVGDTRAKIGELLTRVNAELARIDAIGDAKAFREAISAQTRFLTNSLIEASTQTRWNQGNRLAIESYKALHLMFIPAIEMSEGMSEGTKKLFIEEISKAMTVAISHWNAISTKAGIRNMVMARTAKLTRLLADTVSRVNAETDASKKAALSSELNNSLAKSGINADIEKMRLPAVPTDETELVAHDDALSHFEKVLLNFNAVTLRGAK
jgi:hypothetical protein